MKSVEEYCRLLQQYQLLSSADFAAMRARWFRPDRANATDAQQFCRWLVLNHYVTPFVVQVLSGKHPEQLVFDQYRLYEQRGAGAYAGAYLATDQLHRLVALEVLAPAAVADAPALREIMQAVQKMMEVQHLNVVRTLDFGQAHGLYYLVSEYSQGATVAEVLERRGKLPPVAAARLMMLALEGLEALHAQGVAGGDLTAACLLLAPAGKHAPGDYTVKILNYGLRRRLFDPQALTHPDQVMIPDDLNLADSGMIPLVPASRPNPAEDLFRLGRVFYQALTGKAPFAVDDLPEPREPAPPVTESTPETPELLAQIVERMIAIDPAQRPQRAAHVAKSIRVFLATEETAREAHMEEHIVPRVRHALAQHPPEPEVAEEDDDSAEEAAEPPRRRRLRRRVRVRKPPGLVDRLQDLWDEYQPQERDLVFFTLGPVAFIVFVMILKLFTGWSVENIIWLVAGICLSYFVERVLKWREAHKPKRY